MVKHAALVSNKVPIIHGNRKISYQTIRSEAIGVLRSKYLIKIIFTLRRIFETSHFASIRLKSLFTTNETNRT